MPTNTTISVLGASSRELTPEVIDALTRLASGIRFGSIEVVVHEGRITQIERREKLRIAHDPIQRRA